MQPLRFIVISLTTVLTICVIYAPQPLLPLLMGEFGVDKSRAALLITLTFLPLSLAPIAYGYILQAFSSKRLIRTAVFLLAVTEVFFFFARSFEALAFIRLVQGLLVPAALTALMTYVSTEARESQVQRLMAYYIASTILGGFLGRSVSGLISFYIGWRYSFGFLGLSLFLIFFILKGLEADSPVALDRPSLSGVADILKDGRFRTVYLVVFCLFFAFAALLNFLPFRLTELVEGVSELKIGLTYFGYLMGILVCLYATRIAKLLRGELNAMLIGLALYALTILAFNIASHRLIFACMFVFCAGMFLVHSTASGYVNRYAQDNQGLVNGLYVSFYYTGGTLGSYFPGFIYKSLGWPYFIAFLFLVISFALGALFFYRKWSGHTPRP